MIIQVFLDRLEVSAQTQEEKKLIEGDNIVISGSEDIEVTSSRYGNTQGGLSRKPTVGKGLIIGWKIRVRGRKCMFCGKHEDQKTPDATLQNRGVCSDCVKTRNITWEV